LIWPPRGIVSRQRRQINAGDRTSGCAGPAPRRARLRRRSVPAVPQGGPRIGRKACFLVLRWRRSAVHEPRTSTSFASTGQTDSCSKQSRPSHVMCCRQVSVSRAACTGWGQADYRREGRLGAEELSLRHRLTRATLA
jgi:hypothetical protein